MVRARINLGGILIAVLAALMVVAGVARAEGPVAIVGAPPSVDELIKKVLARAKWVESQGRKAQYSFDDKKVTEELDDDGTVKKKKEQTFHVKPIGGLLYAHMTSKEGKPLTEKEARAEDDREKKFAGRLGNQKTAEEEKRHSLIISEDLLKHFDYKLLGREEMNGHQVYTIRYTPKVQKGSDSDLVERVLHRVAGRVWVDVDDFEMVRMDIELQETVDIWIGIVGSLKKMMFTIERQRLPNGIWVPWRSSGEIQSRKFLSTSWIRYKVESKDYKPLE